MMKVLIVDDDPLAGEMSGMILEDAGFATILAENGMDALELLEATPDIGIVVSDMNMPLISGLDLLHTLRDHGSALPFILLSGDAAAGTEDAEGPRPDLWLLKDGMLDERLVAAVKRLLAPDGPTPPHPTPSSASQ